MRPDRRRTALASTGRRPAARAWALGLAAVFLLAACHSGSADHRAFATARSQLAGVHADDLGRVLGQGSFGSAGLSGSRPTTFVAVRTEAPTRSLMTTLGDRLRRAGFAPYVPCRPPETCTWQRRVDSTLVRAEAVVKTGGQPWGERSTAHGTVAAGTRVLEVSMTVGG